MDANIEIDHMTIANAMAETIAAFDKLKWLIY
jgi:hypothetical protein